VFGTNHLSASAPPAWYSQLFWCFLHPFNVLLCVLAIVSGATGDWNTVIIILLMVSISVGIAFAQERRAIISALALSKRTTQRVRVRRPMATGGRNGDSGPGAPAAGQEAEQAAAAAPAAVGARATRPSISVLPPPR